MRKPVFVICEQEKHRSACAFAQSEMTQLTITDDDQVS